MDPVNTKPNAHTKKSLSEQVDSAPEASSRKAADKKEELVRAPSLNAGPEAEKSIQNRRPEAKQEEASGLSEYEFLRLLPHELRAKIIQYFNLESVCNFIKSLSKDIEAAEREENADREKRLKALNDAKASRDDAAIEVLKEEEEQSLAIGNRHWSIQLFDLCLNEISCHIDLSTQNIWDILTMAKRLGLKEVFNRLPSMKIDFSDFYDSDLSYDQIMGVLKEMSIGVKQLELIDIKKYDVVFSTECFPNLTSLSIQYSDDCVQSDSIEVQDERGTLQELSLARCFHLKTVDIQGCAQLTRLDCFKINALRQIKMGEKNQLKELTLEKCSVDFLNLDALASSLRKSCVKLNLSLEDNANHERVEAFIAKLENLQKLESVNHKFNCGFNLKKLACAASLKELYLARFHIRDILPLAGFHALEGLQLPYLWNIPSESLAVLSGLKKLKKLYIIGGEIESLDFLKGLENLEDLNMSDCSKLKQDSSDALAVLRKLKRLNLRSTKVEDLNFLRGLPDLEDLDLDDCRRLTQDSLGALAGLGKLKSLNLSSTKVKDLNFLRKLPDLEELDLTYCRQLTQDTFAALAGLGKLKSLNLYETSVGNLGFLEGLTKLEKLDLSWCEALTGFNALAGLRKLKELKLFSENMKDLSFLENLPNLKKLDFSRWEALTPEEQAVLDHFKKLPEKEKRLFY